MDIDYNLDINHKFIENKTQIKNILILLIKEPGIADIILCYKKQIEEIIICFNCNTEQMISKTCDICSKKHYICILCCIINKYYDEYYY